MPSQKIQYCKHCHRKTVGVPTGWLTVYVQGRSELSRVPKQRLAGYYCSRHCLTLGLDSLDVDISRALVLSPQIPFYASPRGIYA